MVYRAGFMKSWLTVSTPGIISLSHALTGKVVDRNGTAIEGALVKLAGADLSTISLIDGSWTIPVTGGIRQAVKNRIHKLPVDGEWKSFYSCDKNGTPITRE